MLIGLSWEQPWYTYGKVDEDDIKAKLDVIKCEPKKRV